MKNRPILLDFKSKFNRFDYMDVLESSIGVKLPDIESIHKDDSSAHDRLIHLCHEAKINVQNAQGSSAKLLDKLFAHHVEPELAQPTFITNYPQALSPLAKPHDIKPFIAERFELFVAGKELANAYSELNDPEIQRELLANQNDEEIEDDDYVKCLEYGLPPTAGFGIGIDRLVMLLTNQTSIKEVITFPTLRPIKMQGTVTDQNEVS